MTQSLIDEKETLQEKVRQLENIAGLDFWSPKAWGLTGQQDKMLGLLVNRGHISYEALEMLIFEDRDVFARKIIQVQLCRLRKSLAPLGVIINSHHGRGLSMSNDDRQKIKDACA